MTIQQQMDAFREAEKEENKNIFESASSVDTYAKKISDLSSVEAADKLEDEIFKKARQLSDEVARPMNEKAVDKDLSIDERVTAFRKYLEAEKESAELDQLVGRKGPFMKKYAELNKK